MQLVGGLEEKIEYWGRGFRGRAALPLLIWEGRGEEPDGSANKDRLQKAGRPVRDPLMVSPAFFRTAMNMSPCASNILAC